MSKERRDDAWSRHQQYIANYIKYFSKDPDKERRIDYSKKELDILHEHHRFLRNDDDNVDELSWEQRLAKKYYDRLYKEYALVELKFYQMGRIAMRWRTEKEVLQGKGQFTCGSLRCDDPNGLSSWEVNFAYVEEGVKKNALVKLRLCEPCSAKLNYKTMHKHAARSDTKERNSSGSSSSNRRHEKSSSSRDQHYRDRQRSRSRERGTTKRETKSEQEEKRSTSRSIRDDGRTGTDSKPSLRRDNRSASPEKRHSPKDGDPDDFEAFFAGLFD